MARLNVQIDCIASLRELADAPYPDPVAAAVLIELAGADGLAVHLRADRRYIRDRDLRVLRKVIQTRLILKMAPTSDMLGVALNIKPDVVVIVPEARDEKAPAAGLDLGEHRGSVAETIATLENGGIASGVFIDPDPEQLKLAHQCSARLVEINTGRFCETASGSIRSQVFSRIVDTVKLAQRLKIVPQVGWGLCYQTVKSFQGLKEIGDFTIGHSIVARAVMVGMEKAVQEMRNLIQ
jgi:pyridoxine 5-phosphate synthase